MKSEAVCTDQSNSDDGIVCMFSANLEHHSLTVIVIKDRKRIRCYVISDIKYQEGWHCNKTSIK